MKEDNREIHLAIAQDQEGARRRDLMLDHETERMDMGTTAAFNI
jgi:hypothetical protein